MLGASFLNVAITPNIGAAVERNVEVAIARDLAAGRFEGQRIARLVRCVSWGEAMFVHHNKRTGL